MKENNCHLILKEYEPIVSVIVSVERVLKEINIILLKHQKHDFPHYIFKGSFHPFEEKRNRYILCQWLFTFAKFYHIMFQSILCVAFIKRLMDSFNLFEYK